MGIGITCINDPNLNLQSESDIFKLPNEMIFHTLSFCDYEIVVKFSQTSKLSFVCVYESGLYIPARIEYLKHHLTTEIKKLSNDRDKCWNIFTDLNASLCNAALYLNPDLESCNEKILLLMNATASMTEFGAMAELMRDNWFSLPQGAVAYYSWASSFYDMHSVLDDNNVKFMSDQDAITPTFLQITNDNLPLLLGSLTDRKNLNSIMHNLGVLACGMINAFPDKTAELHACIKNICTQPKSSLVRACQLKGIIQLLSNENQVNGDNIPVILTSFSKLSTVLDDSIWDYIIDSTQSDFILLIEDFSYADGLIEWYAKFMKFSCVRSNQGCFDKIVEYFIEGSEEQPVLASIFALLEKQMVVDMKAINYAFFIKLAGYANQLIVDYEYSFQSILNEKSEILNYIGQLSDPYNRNKN